MNIFKKKSFIKIEFQPDGKPLVMAHIDNDTDIAAVSDFINMLVVRDYLKPVLHTVLESSKKNKALPVGEEILENVLSFQHGVEIRPRPQVGRNPLVKPSAVMRQFEGGDSDE